MKTQEPSRHAQPGPLRVLVFSASLREGSLNTQLARLARSVIERRGALVDFATMRDFDGPSYDQDLETREGLPPGRASCIAGWRRPTPS